jgi:hypothetical protein
MIKKYRGIMGGGIAPDSMIECVETGRKKYSTIPF